MSLFEDVSTLFAAAITDGQDNEAIVKAAYEDLLGYADADTMNNSAARIDYWVQKLSSGELTTDNFGGSFLEEANTNQGSLISSTTFENNQTVVAAHEDAYEANPDVTLEDLTAVAAENRVEDVAEEDEGVTGETFTLTTEIDAVEGTADDDTFAATNATYDTGDTIDGGAGADKLNLTTTAAVTSLVDITSVEQVYARNTQDSQTIDASGWSGIEQLWYDRGSDDLTLTNVGELVTAGINEGAGADSDYTITYDADVVEGDSDVQKIALTSANADVVTIDDVENIEIDSGGSEANAIGELDNNDVSESLIVTGSQNLAIATALEASVTDVDASDADGNVEVEIATVLTAADDTLTVTGGTGDDVINTGTQLSTVNAGASVTLNGGGGTDTLVVDGQIDSDVDVTDDIKNFEQLQLDADAAYNVDGYNWVDQFVINADITAEVISNIAADTDVRLNVSLTDVDLQHVDDANPGTQAMDVILNDADNAVVAGTLTIDGVEDVNLTSTGTDANDIQGLEGDSLENVTLDGDKDITITPDSNIGSSLDASELTGALTAELDATAQGSAIEIKVGSGGSTVQIDVGGDEAGHEITLGDGVDTLDLAADMGGGNVQNAITTMMTVNNFEGGSGGDVIDFAVGDGVATSAELETIQTGVDNALDADAGLTLEEALDAANDAADLDDEDVYFFEFDDNTYVAGNLDGDGTDFTVTDDFVIELVGTDLGLTTADNFVVA